MSNFFCPLPWTSVYIDHKGSQSICCRSGVHLPEKTLDFNHEKIKRVRLTILSGEIPETCEYCANAESNGLISLRKDMLSSTEMTFEQAASVTNEDGSTNLLPIKHDLIMGNKCNLKCVMCMPWVSSSWIEDWNFISNGIFEPTTEVRSVNNMLSIFPNVFNWPDDPVFVDQVWKSIKESSKTGKCTLWFSGGEVTMNPSFKTILQRLVDEGFQNHIDILTNGTSISPSLENLIRKLNIKISFSLDGIGAKNDYLRFPSKFSVIEKNILRFKDMIGRVYITVSSMNVLDIDEVVLWCEENEIKTHFEIVTGPLHWLSPLTLSKRIRFLGAQKLRSLTHKNIKYTNVEDIKSIATALENSTYSSNMSEFWKLVRRFDKRRNTDFLRTFPSWSFVRRV